MPRLYFCSCAGRWQPLCSRLRCLRSRLLSFFGLTAAAIRLYLSLPSQHQQSDISSEQIQTLLEATGNTDVAAFYPIIFSNFLTKEKISEMITSPVSIPPTDVSRCMYENMEQQSHVKFD